MSSHTESLPGIALHRGARTSWGWRRRELGTVARAAVASFAATLLDGIAFHAALAKVGAATHYALAAAVGAAVGAIANFSLNRWWAFRGRQGPVAEQALRYLVGSVLTLAVLQGVMWLLVERGSLDAGVAWLPAKLATWVAFSYPYQRLLVFAGGRK